MPSSLGSTIAWPNHILNKEIDLGSEWTLVICLTHASQMLSWGIGQKEKRLLGKGRLSVLGGKKPWEQNVEWVHNTWESTEQFVENSKES